MVLFGMKLDPQKDAMFATILPVQSGQKRRFSYRITFSDQAKGNLFKVNKTPAGHLEVHRMFHSHFSHLEKKL